MTLKSNLKRSRHKRQQLTFPTLNGIQEKLKSLVRNNIPVIQITPTGDCVVGSSVHVVLSDHANKLPHIRSRRKHRRFLTHKVGPVPLGPCITFGANSYWWVCDELCIYIGNGRSNFLHFWWNPHSTQTFQHSGQLIIYIGNCFVLECGNLSLLLNFSALSITT